MRKPGIRELQENRIDMSWSISRELLDHLFRGGQVFVSLGTVGFRSPGNSCSRSPPSPPSLELHVPALIPEAPEFSPCSKDPSY